MTHLYIEQNTGQIEEVNSSIVSKLYELASSGDLDVTSDLKGRLHTTISYRSEVEYLTSNYPNLYINSDTYAIPFEDPNMVTYLNSINIGSNGVVTEQNATSTTIVANSANTTVTKFNELKYFTNITGSKGGWEGSSSGNTRFQGWTSLEEIDISNFTSIGHLSNSGYEDTFNGCTSLKTVKASSNLEKIGYNAFRECSNLETIQGLSGNIAVSGQAFYGCQKLKQSNFDNVTSFILQGNNNDYAKSIFFGCSLLTTVNLSKTLDTTVLGQGLFKNCSALQNVTGLSGITTIKQGCFEGCSSLQSLPDIGSGITSIEGGQSFKSSGIKCINIANTPNIGNESFFGCSQLVALDTNDIQQLNANSEYTLQVTTLGQSAFRSASLYGKTIVLSRVTSLPAQVFENSNLRKLVGHSITSVGEAAFRGAVNLEELDLGQVTSINNNAFNKCANLTTLKSGGSSFDFTSLTNIGQYVFCNDGTSDHCSQVSIPSNINMPNLSTMGQRCFWGRTEITTISSLGNVQILPQEVFRGCVNLTSVTLPSGLLEINSGSFYNTGLTQMPNIPSTVTTIELQAFDRCAITKFIIPSGVTSVGLSQYVSKNKVLRYIELPSTVLDMKNFFHRSVEDMSDNTLILVIKATTPPALGFYKTSGGGVTYDQSGGSVGGVREGVGRFAGIYVPDASVNDYLAASGAWELSEVQAKVKPISQLQTDSPTWWAEYQAGLSNT